MTKANTYVVAKIAAVVAGLALVATAFAPAARAQSAEEQIQALMAQIAALQAQIGGSSSAGASVTFTRDLTLGSTGSDVTALQNWLISKGHSIPAGATGYFGAQTQAALAAYQAANGISPAAGYFGPITRAKVNAAGGASTGGNGGGSSTGDLKGGEASLEDLKINDGEDDEVEEGGSAQIAEIEFDVEDGDIRIDRIDLTFEQTGGGTVSEDEPWEVFDTVRLLDADGDELAEEDVSDEDDWLDEDDGVFRFTGLDYVVREGETATIIVEVEVQDGVLDSNDTDTWTLTVEDRAVRGVDSEGIQQYLEDTDSISFDVVEEGDADELKVRRSSEDPDSTTFQADEDRRSDWHTVFVFDLEADEDGNDIELDSIQIDFDTGTDGADDAVNVINDVELVIDGETFDDYDFNHMSTEIASTVFDIDGDFTLDAGDRVAVEVRVQFKAGTSFGNSGSIVASVDGDNVHGEGADDVTASGSATGDSHEIAASGIAVEAVKSDYRAAVTTPDGEDNDYAEFEVVVDVTAFEQDVYISATSSAFTYTLVDGDGDSITATGSTTATVNSSADRDGDFYVVDENSSEEFTFRVVYTPGGAAPVNARMQLKTIKFNDEDNHDSMSTWNAAPQSNYETNFAYIPD